MATPPTYVFSAARKRGLHPFPAVWKRGLSPFPAEQRGQSPFRKSAKRVQPPLPPSPLNMYTPRGGGVRPLLILTQPSISAPAAEVNRRHCSLSPPRERVAEGGRSKTRRGEVRGRRACRAAPQKKSLTAENAEGAEEDWVKRQRQGAHAKPQRRQGKIGSEMANGSARSHLAGELARRVLPTAWCSRKGAKTQRGVGSETATPGTGTISGGARRNACH